MILKNLRTIFSLLAPKTPYIICILFFVGFSVLAIVRHNNYGSFGYDLGINDQTVWRYSTFQPPITTIDPLPTQTKLATHVELVYAVISPFYWIWSSPIMLILVRNAWFCFSGVAVYLLARKKGINVFVGSSLVFAYLGFYGVQSAIWFDVHSASFATAFLMWFIYFLDIKKKIPAIIFFFLAITAKENIALLTFLTSLVFFIRQRTKLLAFFMIASIAYLLFIFLIFFPQIEHVKYLYAAQNGTINSLSPLDLFKSSENIQVYLYSLLSFGFLPLLSPLSLLPALGDLATYFMFGSNLPAAQGLFGHYRITLTPFLIWSTILAIGRFKKLNKWYIGLYLIISTMFIQYALHLPLSYLAKQWFWAQPPAVKTINTVINNYLPQNASVVSQNNIIPHIAHRDKIYTLYPEQDRFTKNSPCGQKVCDWFRWYGNPQFLIVDTSSNWDARHLLIDRDPYIKGLRNLEKAGVIVKYKQLGTTALYKIIMNPIKPLE
jgi:uncharacterized membrane protein